MAHTVGEVAKLAKVSVRTLHHYDEIGLLAPTARSKAGYRLYADRDLERLQEVLFYRELGFPLEDIARMLREPKLDRRRVLTRQRALLADKVECMRAMLALVDKTLDGLTKGVTMSKEEMFAPFADEAKERWGQTGAYAESQRRTKRYTKDDWASIKREGEEIADGFAALLRAGAKADDARAVALAERARLHIDRWFYPCPRQMHAALGRMYVEDARFSEYYEKRATGLARFVCDAIAANAGAGTGGGAT
jgi:DNA-binding transcriptional MerR regulator